MILLGLDFETTGLNTRKDHIIEMGLVLWDSERKVPLQMESFLLNNGVALPDPIKELTGLTNEDIRAHGLTPAEGFHRLGRLLEQAAYVVAHNGNRFDRLLYEEGVRRLGLEVEARQWERPWLDTMTDVPYSPQIRTRSLRYLAAEHGIIRPNPHRAMFDAMTTLRLLSKYDLNQVIALSQSPLLTLRAEVSYEDRDQARERGFHWNPEQHAWVKEVKEELLRRERELAPFRIRRMDKASARAAC